VKEENSTGYSNTNTSFGSLRTYLKVMDAFTAERTKPDYLTVYEE
jgi:hypothetical protein